jgi:hypothetical protein
MTGFELLAQTTEVEELCFVGIAGLNCVLLSILGKTAREFGTVRVRNRRGSRTVVRGTVGIELCVQERCWGNIQTEISN